MTSYNGQPCVYDAMGNPTTYRGNVLSWSHVRQLDSFNGNTFAYGADGVRCRKNNTVYTVNGGKLLQETNGSQTLTYYHGGSGIVGFGFNGTDHFFRKNLQGDVTAIYRADGTLEAEYTYDAWGKVLSVVNHTADNIGDRNPIRYRGYYYDDETNLYFLNSRFYNPETGRFLNADAFASTGGLLGNNMFAYCYNNPLAFADGTGCAPMWLRPTQSYFDGSIGENSIIAQYIELEAQYAKSGTVLYHSIEAALRGWGEVYLPLSREHEHVTFLYEITTPLGTRYHTVQTYCGYEGDAIISPNVIIGTLLLAGQDAMGSKKLIAQVHTHPEKTPGYHNDFPSASNNIYGGDRIAYETFHFPEIYILPYSRCSGTPEIIKYTDKSTWCPMHP